MWWPFITFRMRLKFWRYKFYPGRDKEDHLLQRLCTGSQVLCQNGWWNCLFSLWQLDTLLWTAPGQASHNSIPQIIHQAIGLFRVVQKQGQLPATPEYYLSSVDKKTLLYDFMYLCQLCWRSEAGLTNDCPPEFGMTPKVLNESKLQKYFYQTTYKEV